MLFRHAVLFRLPDGLPPVAELDEQLQSAVFAPCNGLDWFSDGFTPPTPFCENLSYPVGHTVRLCLRHEEKVLPPAVINEKVAQCIEKIRVTKH